MLRAIAIVALCAFAGCRAALSPLARAVNEGRTDVVAAMLVESPKPDQKLLEDALLESVRNGHVEMIRILIENGANANYANSDGDTLLAIATIWKQVEVARLLIDMGVDVNRRNKLGHSALSYAAMDGHTNIIKLLLERGADPNTDIALEMAEKYNHSAVARILRSAMSKSSPQSAAPAAQETPSVVRTSDIDSPAGRLPERVDDFALVVGVESYSHDLPQARYAERDAAAVRSHLIALGFPERNVRSLVGGRASKANLEAYLEDWLPRNVKEDSRVFFYFSGHGAPAPESGQAFLVPWDGNPNFLDKTAYPVKKLYASLNALKVRQVTVALDSCFSGAGGRSVLPEGARPLVNKVDMAAIPGGKITLFAAAAPKEITSALEEQGHGMFTYYFLKGLGGAAKESSGAITPRGLYDYLRPKVQDAASRQNREQTPMLEGALDNELVPRH